MSLKLPEDVFFPPFFPPPRLVVTSYPCKVRGNSAFLAVAFDRALKNIKYQLEEMIIKKIFAKTTLENQDSFS